MTAEWVRRLEETLAKIVRHLRGEAEARAVALGRRIDAVERHVDFGGGVEARFYRDAKVDPTEWREFCARLQNRNFGRFDPAPYSTWNGGGHAGDRRS